MTDQQLLGLNIISTKTEIRAALINSIFDLDFEIDIEPILTFIQAYQRLIQQVEDSTTHSLIIDWDSGIQQALPYDSYCDSPEKLVGYFTEIYDNPTIRFNSLFWKSAINAAVTDDSENLQLYCKPIADFLLQRPYIKSEIVRLIANSFPFGDFFPQRKESDEDTEFWNTYGYVYNLLRRGNLELELVADAVNTGQFTSPQLDDIYNRLLYSTRYFRENQNARAFNILTEGIPANIKPVLVWHREVNILYKAVVIEKEEKINGLFTATLNQALEAFPNDPHMLYMRAKYLYHTLSAQEFLTEITTTLKLIPEHPKCLALLGDCYLKLGIARAALIIFENLKKLYPLNMEYVTSTARASRQYINFCINEHDPKENSTAYYINIITSLCDLKMFEDIATFSKEAPLEDPNIQALLMYAKVQEQLIFEGIKDKQLLLDALACAQDKEIIRKIKELYLKGLPNWSDIQNEKEFISTYYQENPTDAMATYQMAMYHFSLDDYEPAYQLFEAAKNADPNKHENYYNLARSASYCGNHVKAIEYIKTYLLYNKYNLAGNECLCDWTYGINDYRQSHLNARWLLSLCNQSEFKAKYFFYLTTSLSLYLTEINGFENNIEYVKETLDLFDQYPKPENYWSDEYGSKAMYWAVKLSHSIGYFERSVNYINVIVKNAKEYTWSLKKLCLLELLPQCLYHLCRYEETIERVVPATFELLEKNQTDADARTAAFYISFAYQQLERLNDRLHWASICVNCYTDVTDPPIEWLKTYLYDNFIDAFQFELRDHAIHLGLAYLALIKAPCAQHILYTHYLALTYEQNNNPEAAFNMHKKCIEYGNMFPNEFQEEIAISQDFINSYNPATNA